MKIADSVWFGLFMSDNKEVQHSSRPHNTGLSGTQFSTVNSAGINDHDWPEQYNNTEIKYKVYFLNKFFGLCYIYILFCVNLAIHFVTRKVE
jgi:hypothetical protein